MDCTSPRGLSDLSSIILVELPCTVCCTNVEASGTIPLSVTECCLMVVEDYFLLVINELSLIGDVELGVVSA